MNNLIIRLICIDKYSGFKYRRGSESRGRSGNGYRSSGEEQVPEFGGRSSCKDMRLSQHRIQEHEG